MSHVFTFCNTTRKDINVVGNPSTKSQWRLKKLSERARKSEPVKKRSHEGSTVLPAAKLCKSNDFVASDSSGESSPKRYNRFDSER